MIQDFPASQQPVWRLIAQETLSVAAAGALLPFGVRRSLKRTPRAREQRTVVLVHGYLANRSTLFPLAVYLKLRGIQQVLSFNYDSGAGIEPAAFALRDYLRKHVRGGRTDLVCHSLGRLVDRLYIQELGGARRVDRFVTLSTPHHGTYGSYWVASRIGRELRPDSPLLARLAAGRANASSGRFVSLIAGSDNIVFPRMFAAHDDEVHLPDLGYLSMLFSARVFRVVADHLARSAAEMDSNSLGSADICNS